MASRRWVMDGPGQERLRLVEGEIPRPGYEEVLVEVAAVSLNYRDTLVIAGKMGDPAYPFSPGSDMAGRVMETGKGATRFAVGDRVITHFNPGWIDGKKPEGSGPAYRGTLGAPLPGVLAQHLVFPEGWLVKAPASLDDAEASTLPVAGVTAWYSLIELGRLRAGETVLVQGTGGVSLFGLQIAVAHGAEAIVTSSDDAKLERAGTMGAAHLINRRRTDDWVQAVLAATGGRGADHILDVVGGANLGRSFDAAAPGGRVSVIGIIEGGELAGSVYSILLKQLTVQGVVVGHRRASEDLVRAADRLRLKPAIDARYAFDALPEALAHLRKGPFGKVIITL